MRNRIAHILKSAEQHAQARGTKKIVARTRSPYVAFAAATLLGVAVIVTLRALFGGPSARA